MFLKLIHNWPPFYNQSVDLYDFGYFSFVKIIKGGDKEVKNIRKNKISLISECKI